MSGHQPRTEREEEGESTQDRFSTIAGPRGYANNAWLHLNALSQESSTFFSTTAEAKKILPHALSCCYSTTY